MLISLQSYNPALVDPPVIPPFPTDAVMTWDWLFNLLIVVVILFAALKLLGKSAAHQTFSKEIERIEKKHNKKRRKK